MVFTNSFYLIILFFVFLNASNAQVQLPLYATTDEKEDGMKDYTNRGFKPILEQVLDVFGPVLKAFVENINPKELQRIHEDREIGTSEDVLNNIPLTTIGFKDVNNRQIAVLDDQTDIPFRGMRPHNQISKTAVLPTQARGAPPTYLRRARRDLQPLSDWIRNTNIHGVRIRGEYPARYVYSNDILKATGRANNIGFDALRQKVEVTSLHTRSRTATLSPKLGSGYSGNVDVHF